MAPISMDLRVRILDARQAGETTAEVAERFAVSPAFVRRLLQRHRETGTLAPSAARRGPRPALARHADHLRQLADRNPGLTAAELRDRLGVDVSPLTVWRMLRRLGYTFKKSRPTPPSGTAPTSGRPGRVGRAASPGRTRNG